MWEQTIQTTRSDEECRSDQESRCGSLVRIYPLELENNLVRIVNSKTNIGREPESEIVCNDSSISRQHAAILKTNEGFFIEDRGSTNGTYVDGELISKCSLTEGCQIRVGNHIFKFLAGNSIEAQYHQTVYEMMTKDGLTNVYNRRYFTDALAGEFDRSETNDRPFSLIMIDIDFFKHFNDTYGHLAGDEVLQEFARRIQSECGTNQILARIGGEEFAIMVIETRQDAAAEFAERVRSVVCSTPFDCSDGAIEVTASFGVSEFVAGQFENFSELLELADQNLYRAKENGRNRVETCPPVECV